MIGHELTALYGLDHAQTLAVVLPGLMRHQNNRKAGKLIQYAERVWGVRDGNDEQKIDAAIALTEGFFRSVGVKTRLAHYGIVSGWESIPARFAERRAPSSANTPTLGPGRSPRYFSSARPTPGRCPVPQPCRMILPAQTSRCT